MRPDLAAQWHGRRNGDLTPDDVALKSNARVWWKCAEKRDHEWEARVVSRTLYTTAGCPFCYGNRTTRSNSLGASRTARARALQREFHPTKNGELTVFDVHHGTARKLWWLCEKGHEWEATGHVRFHEGVDCVACSTWHAHRAESLAIVMPELAREWHPTKNGTLTPADVMRATDTIVWWLCPHDPSHEWQTRVASRAATKSGCPYCFGRLATDETSLAAFYPELAAEWHPTRNGDLSPREVRSGSSNLYWWKCPKGPDHEWQASPSNRTSRHGATGCPCCAGKQVSVTNNLGVIAPALARQWHPTRNGQLTPSTVVAGSHRIVWWRCPKAPDHEWEGKINSRKPSGGCPFCSGRRTAPSDSVAGRFPELLREWNEARNGEVKPSAVHAGSKLRAWWICPLKHEWHCPVNERTLRGRACPLCAEGFFVGAT
jgi:hypothetical protein